MMLIDLLEEWARGTRPSGPTGYRYRRAIETMAAYGLRTTRSLTRERVGAYQQERLRLAVSARTLNTELVALVAVLKWAWRRGRFPIERLQEIRSMRLRQPRQAPPDFYSADEFAALRISAWELAPWFGLAFELACYTGLRRAELIRVEREDVDLEAKILRVRRKTAELGDRGETKSRRERVVSLSPDALELIRKHAPPTGPFFPSRGPARTRFMRHECFSSRILQLSAETGIHATWHKCRRSFTTNALLAGVPAPDVASMLGHAGLNVMFSRYRAWLTNYVPAIERLSFRGDPAA